ncbi:Uncharacterized protein YutD [Pilibacter termitis]|uniref:Uncharacterized protein YutD n=1 Tax=Pilibacter termitis TaxID=263852 RepID=A0A1T4LFW6_9ENTE|nr:YutD family protein [Pilibacter termitis]SJZ53583.1 Uncharacterized protein YutD [Pilibacter termitis]
MSKTHDLSQELEATLDKIHEEEKAQEKKLKKLWTPENVDVDGEIVQIGERKYRLVYNHREAFEPEKLGERFSEVLSRYDYVVGDWGYEQLRLKGFFNSTHKKALAEQKIDTLEDYLYEFCNFGCAFFVLERIGGKHERYRSEEVREYSPKKKRKNYGNKKRQVQNQTQAHTREKISPVNEKKPKRVKPVFKQTTTKKENQPKEYTKVEKKRNFTIRQKG